MSKIYEFSGTHREIGLAHGEELREAVRASLDVRMSRCIQIAKKAGNEMDPDVVRALGRECLAHLGEFSPGQLEEVQGIAEGAGVSPEEVLITSGYTDVKDLLARGKLGGACECTALWAGPEATTDGAAFVAQTWDMFSEAADDVLWLKLAVDDQPTVFLLSYAGCLGMTGMNDRGVALAINNLIPTDAQVGVPWTFLNRAILAADDAEDAYAAMRRARLCSGHNFVIGDSSGKGFSVETTGTKMIRIDPPESTYAHSNHYLAPELLDCQVSLEPVVTSPVRVERMDAILREGRGRIDREFVEKALRDHENDQCSICVHEKPTSSGATVSSCAALVMDTRKREVGYIKGSPCKDEFARLSLA